MKQPKCPGMRSPFGARNLNCATDIFLWPVELSERSMLSTGGEL
ncbi:hypothetical protein R5R35_009212 [Gryllus longicercus]|uniref:Uncharacterized protein n=1 Tax=Gryllus longicercus TaxID=2509291 RepID=A0AAN9VGJ6_9ORTH